jgi:hypothetical protein
MTFNVTNDEIKTHTFKRGEPGFVIKGKYSVISRASLHIKHECPAEYSLIIQKCFQRGWIELAATMTERERIFMGLANE